MQKRMVKKIDLGLVEELQKIRQFADKLEQQGKELAANESKATALLKQAYKLLEPIGNFQETQIESMLADLKRAGLESSAEYKDLASSYDYISRINATVKRMASEVSRAIN